MNTNAVLPLLGVLLVILGALFGWRQQGWMGAIIGAITVAVVVLVVIVLIRALGLAVSSAPQIYFV